MTKAFVLASESAAMDGGLTAIAEVAEALREVGLAHDTRLIGGVTVLLHIQRLGLDLPLRATGDADFGIPPYVLRSPDLVRAIEERGYGKVAGNRWERPIDDRRVAAVDLMVPAYTSRARDTVQVGEHVTTEVPGLALALRRPAVIVETELVLTDRSRLAAEVVIPDAAATLALKAGVRTVRREDRDAEDLGRCLEIAAADGVTPDDFASDRSLAETVPILERELGPNGSALVTITEGLGGEAATRRRTRIRGLLAQVVGIAF